MKCAKIVKTVRREGFSIDVREYRDGRFGFEFYPPFGKRVRVRKLTKESAAARAEEVLKLKGVGKLDRMGIAENEFVEFLQWKASRRIATPVPALVERFLAIKKGKGRSEWTVRDLKGALNPFAEYFNVPIDEVTRYQVEAWLDGWKVGPRRWNNLRNAVVSLVRFAKSERALLDEISPIEQIEPRKVETSIETYTRDEIVRLLKSVDDEWLPAVVLGAFAGIRPEEVCADPRTAKPSLTWECFLWKKDIIDVPKLVSKVNKRRFVPMSAPVKDMLLPWVDKKGPVVPRKRLANAARRWVRDSGVKWINDGLRHSYASYRLAQINDIQKLALEMGNSAKIIHDHYLELKHEDEAEEWFAVRWKDIRSDRPENVVAFA